MALISTGKIERLFEEEQERSTGSESLGSDEVKEVEIKNSWFGYNGNPVIKGLSLKMKSGDRVVITGESGAGKTTLCTLLSLLNEPAPGQIWFNNRDITRLSPSEVRNRVALVSGEMPLIPGTLIENITYGNTAVFKDIDRFRGFLPDKVWEKPGLMVNGADSEITSGEARKIAFARALLRNPSFLILDEALSFMDDTDIDRALQLIPREIITLIISRNSSVMKNADRIYKLSNGVLNPLE
jgi:ABC-type multidrug transport system fused ATPase/permease subunit